MAKTKWYQKPIYLMVALALVLSLGIVALAMAGTVGAHPGIIQVDVNDPSCVTASGQPDPYSVVYCSIQDAIDDATAWDTINVAAGTYDETVKLTSTTASDISLVGENRATTFITGGVCFATDYSGLRVQNFTITGNGYLNTETYEATVSCEWPTHYAVTNLEFSDCVFDGEGYDDGKNGRCGVLIKRLGGVVKFENNEFKNYRGWATLDVNDGSEGGPLTVTNYTFNNNNVHDNWGSCALRGNPAVRTDTVTVSGNTFNNNGNLAANSWAALEINEADSVTVSENTITNTQQGIWGEGEALQFWHITLTSLTVTGNTIANNYQGIYFPGGAWASNLSGVHINFNNIYGNTQFGIKAEADNTGTADAENNWWGAKDGPSGVGPGSGDAVSDDVDYDPWLGAELEEVEFKTINGSGTMQDTPTGGDITIDAVGNHTITAAKYVSNPGGPCPFTNEGSYYDVHLDDATNVTSLTIQFCPAHENEVICYWNGSAWVQASNQVYSGGCIVVTITDETQPSLSDLTGLLFGKGFPVPVGGEAYPLNKLAILAPWIALAVLSVGGITWLTLRRRRA